MLPALFTKVFEQELLQITFPIRAVNFSVKDSHVLCMVLKLTLSL